MNNQCGQVFIIMAGEVDPRPINWAENLLALASNLLIPKARMMMPGDPCGPEIGCARAATALKFWSMPKQFQLRAQVEEWDIVRIIREMY